MTEHRPTDAESTRRAEQGRRIKRGIVAGYIHELSERHNDTREELRAEERGEDIQGGLT
jgi:hypothetical protein